LGIRDRRIGIGKKRTVSLLTVLLAVLCISIVSVSAAAYVVLQWTTNATVVANPQVCFFLQGTSTKENTFSYSVNIFPNIKTIDENITYGLWNWHASETRNVYFRMASSNTNSSDVTSITYKVYLTVPSSSLYSKTYTAPFTDTDWDVSATTVAANTKYAIYIEIQAASGATVGHTPSWTFEVKVENP